MPRIHAPIDTARRFREEFGARPVALADAVRAGLTRDQLRAAVGRGLLLQPRRGLYAASLDDGSAARLSHLTDVRAALAVVGPEAVATHDSAALVLDSRRVRTDVPDVVTLARRGIQDFAGPGLVVRGSDIPSAFVSVVDGIPVTDIRRTAVDLARGHSLPQALIPLDDALRRIVGDMSGAREHELRLAVRDPALVDRARQELRYAVESCRGWPGILAVRRALPHASPASESALESRSRGWFLLGGLPPLEVGVAVAAGGTTYWADFCSHQHRVIGEADGWGKYGEEIQTIRERMAHEKRRQAALESAGWRVVRWTSSDARASVVDRMRAALRSD